MLFKLFGFSPFLSIGFSMSNIFFNSEKNSSGLYNSYLFKDDFKSFLDIIESIFSNFIKF